MEWFYGFTSLCMLSYIAYLAIRGFAANRIKRKEKKVILTFRLYELIILLIMGVLLSRYILSDSSVNIPFIETALNVLYMNNVTLVFFLFTAVMSVIWGYTPNRNNDTFISMFVDDGYIIGTVVAMGTIPTLCLIQFIFG